MKSISYFRLLFPSRRERILTEIDREIVEQGCIAEECRDERDETGFQIARVKIYDLETLKEQVKEVFK